jgi:hypothetical protein
VVGRVPDRHGGTVDSSSTATTDDPPMERTRSPQHVRPTESARAPLRVAVEHFEDLEPVALWVSE